MELLLILLLSLPIILYIIISKRKIHGSNLPPGPKGFPIIGNMLEIKDENPHHFFYRLSNRFGPIVSLKIGSRRIVVVSTAELAKDVLKTQDSNFCNRPHFFGQQKMSYNGLDIGFAQYTPYWQEIRKLCSVHLFSANQVESFRPIRTEEVSRMMEKVYNVAAKSEVVDLSETMLSFTNSVICRVAFGKYYVEYGSEMKRFVEVIRETQAMFGMFFFKDYFPYLGWVDNVTGMNKRLDRAATAFDNFLQGILDEHLDPNVSKKPEKECLVDILIKLVNDQPFEIDFTYENIKAITLDVTIAGTDSAASALVWAMTYLIKYPKTLKKTTEEIRTLIGNRGYVTEDDITNLPYLKAVIKEALRLEPVIPLLIPREAINDCIVGGYDIPAKTILRVNAWAVSRDREAWGENAEEFRPERYLEKNVDFKGQDFEFIPFGSGRRMCPALLMGVSMLELPLGNLLYKFDWELPCGVKAEDISMDASSGLGMHKKEHLKLIPVKYI